MKKYLLIYHREDNDGLFSAAIFYDYLINKIKENPENIDFLPADYNLLTDFQNKNSIESLHETYDSIIMTDISFNDWHFMKSLWNEFKYEFIWCDHHAPIIKCSIENRFDDIPGIRDTKRSAILCVYKYLYDQFDEAYNDKKIPELFRILSAYDSFTYEANGYKLDYVKIINKGITSKYDLNFAKILQLVHDILEVYLYNNDSGKFNTNTKDTNFIKSMYTFGNGICKYDDQCFKNIIESEGDLTWKIKVKPTSFRKACCIFHQGPSNSFIFNSLKNTEYDNGIVFHHKKNGNWTVSLYNINTDDHSFHCGDFLKLHYNGGGHEGAAGMTISQDKFIEILTQKTL